MSVDTKVAIDRGSLAKVRWKDATISWVYVLLSSYPDFRIKVVEDRRIATFVSVMTQGIEVEVEHETIYVLPSEFVGLPLSFVRPDYRFRFSQELIGKHVGDYLRYTHADGTVKELYVLEIH